LVWFQLIFQTSFQNQRKKKMIWKKPNPLTWALSLLLAFSFFPWRPTFSLP
jgi:hypothetical protein